MNDQSWWRLTLALSFFLLWLQSFEIMAYYPWQLPPSISLDKIMSGRYILKVWIFLYLKDWYQSLFCSTYYPRTCFFRKVGAGSLQIFNKWCFSNGNDKTWIYILVIHRWKINHFDCTERTGIQVCMAKLAMFPSCNLRLLSLNFIITMIFICATFHCILPCIIFKPQAK